MTFPALLTPSALAPAWHRLQRATRVRIPPEVQQRIEREWLRDAALRDQYRGVFLAYAKERCLQIARERVEGGDEPQEAAEMATGKGVALESMTIEQLSEHFAEVRDALARAKRGGAMVPRLEATRDELRRQLALVEGAIGEVQAGRAMPDIAAQGVTVMRYLPGEAGGRPSRPQVGDAVVEQIRELRKQNLSYSQIAAQLGESNSRVAHWCQRLGLGGNRAGRGHRDA